MNKKNKNNETLPNGNENAGVEPSSTASENGSATVENTNATAKKTPGRPVDENSDRQKRLLEMEMKKIMNGGVLHRGRPIDAGSDRQKRLATKDPNAKPGRPKMGEEAKALALAERKARQEANAKAVAEKAKATLIAAGLLNEDGTKKEGVTAEQLSAALTPVTVA
jgi:hypothetical protein